MEPWFAALALPTAAVPSAAAHNDALAWRKLRHGHGVGRGVGLRSRQRCCGAM